MVKEKEIKINVSFKRQEIEMYNFLKSQRSPSNYIKDAVEFYRKHAGNGKEIEKTPHKEEPKERQNAPSDTQNMLDF